YDAPKPNLLILANTDIEGGRSLDGFETRGRDGIHLGTGFDFDFDFEPGLLTALVTSGSPFGGVTEASVNGGSVVIDLNGHAKHTATGADYAPASDQVVLGDYTFDGVIRGTDDGIEVEGDIGLGAGVFIRRNMVVGSGDTGIVFASIGQTGADYLDKVCEGVDVSTSVTVLNNFILANGQALIDEDTENDSGVEGDGIHFTGAIGAPEEVRTAIKIFQNFIAQNQTDGVHVDEAAGDGASLIALNQNFVPAGVSPDPDRNGRFGLLNQATGAIDADANWWGTADPSLINTLTIGFFANGPVTLASILSSGLDSNLEIDPGRTEFDNFAFQAAAAIGLPVPPPGFTPPAFVFDPTLIRFTPPNLGVPPDTPGDAWYRWS
ncbi:MAG: hypothetical protein IRY94_21140, partial [Rhodospirillaceae bacterium]|nr:hypothetical protein [Rhodospirillaceae bacterium]